MAFLRQPVALDVPEGEALIGSGPKRALSSDSFSFAVTQEAVYLPVRKKGFTLRDPCETLRVPLSAVRGVTLSPARASTERIVLGAVVAGLFLLVLIGHVLRDKGWKFELLLAVFWTYIFISTLLGPRGRYRVRVDGGAQPLDFEPHVAVMISAKAKAAELEVQTRFLEACRRAGLAVVDSRVSPAAMIPPTTGSPHS